MLTQAHRHFGLRVRAFGNRMDLIKVQDRAMGDQCRDRVEDGVDRTIATLGRPRWLAVNFQIDFSGLWAIGSRNHTQAHYLDRVVIMGSSVVHQGDNVVVIHVLFTVCERFKATKCVLERIV